MGIVFIIGVVQAFFIEFILLKKKNKGLSDKILAVWMFFIGVHLFFYYLNYIQFHQQYPHILGVTAPLPLIHGPFLLLYVISLIGNLKSLNRLLLLHFVPALSYYLALTPKFMLSAQEKLRFVFEELPSNPPIYMDIYSMLINISGPVYIIWSLFLLKRHHKNIVDNFSDLEKISLKWLRNLIIGMAIIWFAVLVSNIMDDKEGSNLVFGAVTLFIFLVGYFGIRQGVIFTDNFNNQNQPDGEPRIKYQKSTLSQDKIQTYIDQLLSFMEKEKPYLENKITLPALADQLNMNPNYLSQVINVKLNQNFYDFINKHRVEEFKRRLNYKTARNFTLVGHALESGFSSKSSFQEVFKKFTGQTPSQYQKNLPSVK